MLPSLKLTASLPLRIGQIAPKGNFIFQPSIFRCYVSFREGTSVTFRWLAWKCLNLTYETTYLTVKSPWNAMFSGKNVFFTCIGCVQWWLRESGSKFHVSLLGSCHLGVNGQRILGCFMDVCCHFRHGELNDFPCIIYVYINLYNTCFFQKNIFKELLSFAKITPPSPQKNQA